MDRVALVTGASQGIGLVISTAFVDAGINVWMVARDRERLEKAAADVGGRAYTGDIADPDVRDQLLATILDTDGHLDILVNNAGTITQGPTINAHESDLRAQLETNLVAPYLLTRDCLHELHGGDIVFVNSSAVKHANPGMAGYAASKHALAGFADSLRAELTGIRVLTVYLGRTASPMQATLHETEGKEYRPERLLQPEDVAHTILAAVSLPRTAEITELSIRPAIK